MQKKNLNDNPPSVRPSVPFLVVVVATTSLQPLFVGCNHSWPTTTTTAMMNE